MRSARASYLAGISAVAASTVASAAAGFASLWFLTQVLSKDLFGAYTFSMSVVMLLAIVGTMGLDRVLLLRVAALPTEAGVLRGSALARRVLAFGGAAALTLAVLLWLFADRVVAAGAPPEAHFWLRALAAAIVPVTLAWLAQAWFQANHRVSEATVLPGLVDLARAVLIGTVFMAGGGAAGVAAAVIAAACLPVAVLAWKSRIARRESEPHRIAGEDFRLGVYFVLQNLSNQGLRYFDLVLVGLVTTAVITADYAVAARLAVLCDMGRLALKPTFTPRARRYLGSGASEGLAREYHLLRLGGLVFALAGSAGFVLFGEWLLSIFGPYASCYQPMLVLCAAYVVGAGAGMHSSYLAMSGEVRTSATIRLLSLALFVAALVVLAPRHGALGAAFAMLAAQVMANGVSLAMLRRRTGFVGVPVSAAVVAGLSVLALCSGGLGMVAGAWLAVILIGLASVAAAVEHQTRRVDLLCRRKGPGPSDRG